MSHLVDTNGKPVPRRVTIKKTELTPYTGGRHGVLIEDGTLGCKILLDGENTPNWFGLDVLEDEVPNVPT